MRPFDHYTPVTLEEALELLARHNGSARPLAGGTDLVLRMKNGLEQPRAVVNLKRLEALRGIALDEEGGLRIGALTPLREVQRSEVLHRRYPAVAHAARVLASEQIRSVATIGGNLCNASPAADMPPPLLVHDAEVRLVSLHGERTLPLAEFFTGPGQTVLRPGELLREVVLPPPRGEAVYLKLTPRAAMDIAVVGVAVCLAVRDGVCEHIRIALGAVAPIPLRARRAEAVLQGQALTAERIAQAAEAAADECSPIDDVRASAWYRRRMVQVLTRRALTRLAEDTA